MRMEPQPLKYKVVIEDLAKEFIEKVSFINESNNGLFQALLNISEKMQLWELFLILKIAEAQPIKTEDLISQLDLHVSKSTIYRKIADGLNSNVLIKGHNGDLSLANSYRAIEIVAKIHKKLNTNK